MKGIKAMEKIVLKTKVDYSKMRNEMHFEVQRSTRMNVFRDRTKYSRKAKHKGKEWQIMAVVYQRGSWYYGGENYDVYFKGGYTYFSDISGEEIDDKEVYYYNGKHCNRDEIIELLGYIDSEKYLEN